MGQGRFSVLALYVKNIRTPDHRLSAPVMVGHMYHHVSYKTGALTS